MRGTVESRKIAHASRTFVPKNEIVYAANELSSRLQFVITDRAEVVEVIIENLTSEGLLRPSNLFCSLFCKKPKT